MHNFSSIYRLFKSISGHAAWGFSEIGQIHTLFQVNAMRIICSLVMIAVLFMFPDSTTRAAKAAIRLWGMDIVPSLFPYMVLSRQLSAALRKRGSGVMCAILLGLLGGSPSGAASIGQSARGAFSRRRLLSFCALTGTISPMFLTGTISVWLGSRSLGMKLLAAHLFAAVLSAWLVFVLTKEGKSPPAPESNALRMENDEPIRESVYAVWGVGGCIVFFSVMAEAACTLLPVSEETAALLHGILEISGGIKALSECRFSFHTKGILCAALCGFSGVSILSQNLMFLRPLGIRMAQLVWLGALRALCGAMTMAGLLMLFP